MRRARPVPFLLLLSALLVLSLPLPSAAQSWLDLPMPTALDWRGIEEAEACARDAYPDTLGACVGLTARRCVAAGGWEPPAAILEADALGLWCDGLEHRVWVSIHDGFMLERGDGLVAAGRPDARDALWTADAAFRAFLRAECDSEVAAWGATLHREAARARMDCEIDLLSRRAIAVRLRGLP